MTSGQTALSLSDLPFAYSILNLLFIWSSGTLEDTSRFFVVGLVAGLAGTFLISWHPIQWILDRILTRKRDGQFHYPVPDPYRPRSRLVQVKMTYFVLSLKINAIKFLKDKIAAQVYFEIILITLSILMMDTRFLTAVHLVNSEYLFYLQVVIPIMMIGMGYLIFRQLKDLLRNLGMCALYFHLLREVPNSQQLTDYIKAAIDLGDWTIVREQINSMIKSNWDSLGAIFPKEKKDL